MTENAIAQQIVDAAFRIHTTLGPGLLESVYDTVLAYELNRRELRTTRQQPIPVVYEGVRIDVGFRADLIVEDKVIVEIKSLDGLDLHDHLVFNYQIGSEPNVDADPLIDHRNRLLACRAELSPVEFIR